MLERNAQNHHIQMNRENTVITYLLKIIAQCEFCCIAIYRPLILALDAKYKSWTLHI